MEIEVKKMIFQAKRLFTVDVEKATFAEYGIHREEVWFWFITLYRDKLEYYWDTINKVCKNMPMI